MSGLALRSVDEIDWQVYRSLNPRLAPHLQSPTVYCPQGEHIYLMDTNRMGPRAHIYCR